MKQFLRVAVVAAVAASLVGPAQPVSAGTAAVTVRVTLTSVWQTKSPDPMGITYNPRAKRLFISDSEVDETSFWKGRNFFIAKRGGRLLAARTFRKFTMEPEDVAWDNRHGSLYVVDDNLDRVFRVGRGKDGMLGTRDDKVVTVLNTRRFGSYDPEGLAWRARANELLITDSGDSGPNTHPRVCEVLRGKDKRFGTKDDIVRIFGLARYGFTAAEDVAVNGKRLFIVSSRQRFIVVTNLKGQLLRKIDTSGVGIKAASGITFAPGTDGGRGRIYVTDSGVDNAVDPTENDGRLFELKLRTVP
jgi:DNA-binding beta-propeller fold protein YncE